MALALTPTALVLALALQLETLDLAVQGLFLGLELEALALLCDMYFLQQLSVSLLQKIINHFIMIHMATNDIR